MSATCDSWTLLTWLRQIRWVGISAAVFSFATLQGIELVSCAEKPGDSKPEASPADSKSADSKPAKVLPVLTGADLYSHILRGTALIVSDKGDGKIANGTAWVIDRENCLLVTAAHCVGRLNDVRVYFPNHRNEKIAPTLSDYLANKIPLIGRVIDTAPQKDLAIIRVGALPAGTTELPLAPRDIQIDPGSTVGSIGNPTGVEGTLWIYTTGAVRQVRRSEYPLASGARLRARIVETSAPANPGDSGGAVVNDRGQVIGVINSANLSERLRTNCVHVREVSDFWETVRPWVSPKSAEDFFERGKNYLEKERFKLALRDFNTAIDDEPETAEYYCARGEAHFGLNAFDDAADDLARAIKKNDELPDAYCIRGLCYFAQGEFKNALDDFDQAIEISPKFSKAFAGKALLASTKGKHDEAVRHLSDALRHEPDGAKYYSRRGLQYYALALAADQASESENQYFKRAFEDLTDAIRLEGSLPKYLEQRGNILREAGVYFAPGNYASASRDYGNAIKYDVKNANPYLQRGIMYRKLRKFDDALRDIEVAAKLSDKRGLASIYVEKGNTLLLAAKKKEAEKAFQQADSLSPGASSRRFKNLKQLTRRALWVRNMANQPIEFYVLFYTPAGGSLGNLWFPGEPGSVESGRAERFTVKPGEIGRPYYSLTGVKPFPITAIKIRIWGVGKTDGKRFDIFKDKDLVIVPDKGGQYIAPVRQRWVHTFYD